MRTQTIFKLTTILCTLALVACGEFVEDATCDTDCETGEQRSGLDLDPLSGLDLDDGPDLNDVPADMQSFVSDTKDGLDDSEKIISFYGRLTENDDVQEYTYRADIEPMAALSDDEFEVAADILARRNDITGVSETPLESNGMSDGEGNTSSQFFTMVTYDPTADPEPGPDIQARIDMIEDEIATAMDDNGDDPNLDSQGRLEASMAFDWNYLWFYHVDVFEPSEVVSEEIAIDTGESRAETEMDAKFDDVASELDELAECVENDRSTGDAVGVYGCNEDLIGEVVEVAGEIEEFSLFGDLSSGPSGPSNSSNGLNGGGG